MEKERLKKIRKKLELERKNLVGIIRGLKDHSRLEQPLTSAITELSSYDNHPGDSGSQLSERSKDFGLVEISKIQLEEVERALTALDQGKYGLCLNCGDPIPPERLEILPYTHFCLQCKKEMEISDHKDRPKEEEAMFPPFQPTSIVGIDGGQDAWKAVARYGTSSYTERNGEEEENGDRRRNRH